MSAKIRIYTNDLALERAKQEKAAQGNRLQVLRNRVARGHATKLAAIAIVAKERGDSTIESEARNKLVEFGFLSKGEKLADRVEIVPSRRDSRSKRAAEFGLVAA